MQPELFNNPLFGVILLLGALIAVCLSSLAFAFALDQPWLRLAAWAYTAGYMDWSVHLMAASACLERCELSVGR